MKSPALLLSLLSCLAVSAPAGVHSTEETIAHLLQYTAESKHVFIRNGQEFSASDAARLMRYKCKANRDEIETAEDFIRLAATKSTVSGKPYLVKMADGKAVPTAEWLAEALRQFRAGTPP